MGLRGEEEEEAEDVFDSRIEVDATDAIHFILSLTS
jgi:hypothetical protein